MTQDKVVDGMTEDLAAQLAATVLNDEPSDGEATPATPSPSPRKKTYIVSGGPSAGVYDRWSRAGHASVGVPGSTPRAIKSPVRVDPLPASPSAFPETGDFYVVLKGTCPGIYTDILSLLRVISNVDGVFYQTFSSQTAAVACWTQAIKANLLVVLKEPKIVGLKEQSKAQPQFSPSAKGRAKGWVVFKGLIPGVYDTWEACKAQTHRVSCSIHESFPTLTLAHEAFREAVKGGEVSVLA